MSAPVKKCILNLVNKYRFSNDFLLNIITFNFLDSKEEMNIFSETNYNMSILEVSADIFTLPIV